MDRAYLARHLFEGERLKKRALVEFTSAMRSGRMIAFVGSYVTENIGTPGYEKWKGFLQNYAKQALAKSGEPDDKSPRVQRARAAIEAMTRAIESSKSTEDALASLSVIEYALAYANEQKGDVGVPQLQSAGAEMFHLTMLRRETDNNVKRIVRGLGIDRVVTLNYDLEFEWELMTTIEERAAAGAQRHEFFNKLMANNRGIVKSSETSSLTRILPNGQTVISDIFSRDRTDRLIEFAVGSPDQEAHILHLHGRATDPSSMIVSQRDYNKQYRRSGVARLPFERALRMLFAGNPILFVGVGMSERDVTGTLEQFVSDHPNRRISPAFILWNGLKTAEESDAVRFRWLHRFGVLTLFDDELLGPGEARLPRSRDAALIMAKAISDLAERSVEQARPFAWQDGDFRSVRAKFAKRRNIDPDYIDVWPTVHSKPHRTFSADALKDELAKESPITVFVAEPGAGKGELARALRTAWHGNDPDRRSCIINASFAFETDAMFSLISGLSDDTPASEEVPPRSRGKSLDAYLRVEQKDRQILIVINGMERFFSPSGAPLSVELDALVRKLAAIVRALESERKRRQDAQDEAAARQVLFRAAAATAVAPAVGLVPGQLPQTWQPAAAEERQGVAFDRPATPSRAVPAHDFGSPFQIALLGTARVRRYFEGLQDPTLVNLVRFADEFSATHLRRPESGYAGLTGSIYLGNVIEAFERRGCAFSKLAASARATIEQKKLGDRAGIRRAVLSAYLQSETLALAGVRSPDLCLDILAVMAFIGQPVEDAVLIHAPRIRSRLTGLSTQRWDGDAPAPSFEAADAETEDFRSALKDLLDLGLIVGIEKFPGSSPNWRRYGLHRSLLAELRDRHGVPLSDSQLSAGFNLSVFVAQPADGYSPERDLHQELGNLADWLIGSYKDAPLGGFDELEDDEPGVIWQTGDGVREDIRAVMFSPEHHRAWPHVSACLRAALALMRSYYSTSTLLTLDHSDGHPTADEDGPLTEHADRLERLLEAARRHATARRSAAAKLGDKCKAWLAPPPFYPDDLVWLHNELGVVKLAQGDLYEARLSFEEALRINRDRVEFRDRGPNWRRITLNQVHVDIERGSLDRAESRLDQIEESLSDFLEKPPVTVRNEIAERFGRCPARDTHAVDVEYGHEVILCAALIFGYRALCLHLRGHLRGAKEYFELATSILDNVGEQRAHAMFQKYSGSLFGVLGDNEASDRSLRLSIASAEATRQTDVAYHARVSQAWNGFKRTKEDRAGTLRKLQSALLYAEAGDMHRVRVEAGLNLARVKLDGGDFDAALEHAADAMATATRYGLSLRKISLRTLIGQILIRRGDPEAGRALLDRAIRNADRINYQRAVEEAQQVLLSESASRP